MKPKRSFILNFVELCKVTSVLQLRFIQKENFLGVMITLLKGNKLNQNLIDFMR